MAEKNNLINNIEILRTQLEYLIDINEGDLLNEEVIDASKALNVVLNKYTKKIKS